MRVKRSLVVAFLVVTLMFSFMADSVVLSKTGKYPAIKHSNTMKLKVGQTKSIKLKVRADCKILTTQYKIVSGKGIIKAGKKKGTFKAIKTGSAKIKIRVTYYTGMYTFKKYIGYMTVKVTEKKVVPTPTPTNTPTPTPTAIPSATPVVTQEPVTGSAVNLIQ